MISAQSMQAVKNKFYGGWFRVQIAKTSELMTDMTRKGAASDELERCIRYSDVLIRFAKDKDQKGAKKFCEKLYNDFNIKDLERKYIPE